MKKINSFKLTLFSLVAVLIALKGSSSLEIINKNNSKDYNAIDINFLVRHITDSMNYKVKNIDRLNKDSILVNYDKATSHIVLDNESVFIDTTYLDGYIEKDIINLSNFTLNDIAISERHVVSDSYDNKQLNSNFYDENGRINNLGKEAKIMEVFNITQEQLDFVLAGPMAEGIENNYIDVSAVMRTGINRLFSYAWLGHAIDRLGLNCSYNEVSIYDIFADPYQFAVYYSFGNKAPRYERFLGIKEGEGYQGALDTLYYSIFNNNIPDELVNKIVIHDYLEFQDVSDPIPGSYTYEQFVSGGNKHYRHQKEADKVVISDSILGSVLGSSLEDENVLVLR